MSTEKIEPVLLLLVGVMLFFVLTLFLAEYWFQSDSQLFQVMAQLLSGIAGAFMGRIKPGKTMGTDVSSSGKDATVIVKESPAQ